MTLYDGIVDAWLLRDGGKHQIRPEHKLALMRTVAARLWRTRSRSVDAETLEDWLLDALDEMPRVARHYARIDLDLLKEDLRNATFLVWNEAGGFRFAHTSMQEYFLADHLVDGLEDGTDSAVRAWSVPTPSHETFDFVADRLDERPDGRRALGELLRSGVAGDDRAIVNAFRFSLRMHASERWTPSLRGLRLSGAVLEDMEIAGTRTKPLDLSEARFVDCTFRRCELRHLRLNGARLDRVEMTQGAVIACDLRDGLWSDTRVIGAPFRANAVEGARLDCERWRSVTSDFALGRESSVEVISHEDRRRTSPEAALRARTHAGGINSSSFDAAGTRFAFAGRDGTVRVWDAGSGEERLRLEGHSRSVRCCAFDAAGARIVSAGIDGTVRVWDADSGELRTRFERVSSSVRSCAFDAAGARIVSAGDDGTARVWDADSGKERLRFGGHSGSVRSCAFDATGARVVSAGIDGTVRVWDADSGEEQLRLEGHALSVSSCGFDAAGARIVSAGIDGTVRVWDVAAEFSEALRIVQIGNACVSVADDGRKFLHQIGDAWRHFVWTDHDENGAQRVLPFEAGLDEEQRKAIVYG